MGHPFEHHSTDEETKASERQSDLPKVTQQSVPSDWGSRRGPRVLVPKMDKGGSPTWSSFQAERKVLAVSLTLWAGPGYTVWTGIW